MIREIEIKNFKSLKDIANPVTNLNVLTGLNGSGKSSFIQMLLLLRQSFGNDLKRNLGLVLDRGIINLGTGKDVLYQFAGKEEMIETTLIWSNEASMHWEFNYNPSANLLPLHAMNINEFQNFNLFNDNFQYLNAEHIPPQKSYKKSESDVIQKHDIGTKGEYAVHYLSEFGTSQKVIENSLLHQQAFSDSLIHQVDAWIGEISPGVRLVVEDLKGIDSIRLGVKYKTNLGYTDEFTPVNVGFGIPYVLPVVLAILKAQKGDILILENPESHLHPKGQSIIGKLMAFTAQAGVQIFVETHSDHIINGIRVAVKNKTTHKENVKIFFFKRDQVDNEQYTCIDEILIDKNGELSQYPQDFLDEWNEQLLQLI